MRKTKVPTGRFLLGVLAVAVVVCGAAPARAAELWIEPTPSRPEQGETVTLRLFLGERLSGEERALKLDQTTLFQRIWKHGRENLPGDADAKPVGRFEATEKGLQLVAYSYAGKRPQDGWYTKAFVIVGDAAPDSPIRYSEVGQRLEIVPQTDPVVLARRGGALELQVLFDREPLAGAVVLAMPESDPRDGSRLATTDEIGVTTVVLDRPGRWLIVVKHKTESSRSRSTLLLDSGSKE